MPKRYREIQKRNSEGDVSASGFTLIELLIVIVVLGILAAIVVFSLTGVSGQSKQAACTSDAKSVEIANDAYQAKNSTVAPSVDALVPSYLHSDPDVSGTNGYTIGLAASNGAGSSGVTVTNTSTNATTPFVDSTGCTSSQIG